VKIETYGAGYVDSKNSAVSTIVHVHSNTNYKHKERAMSKFNVIVPLVGQDGNAFAIMGRVSRALEKAGASKEEVNQYMDESMSGDYDNLLRVATQWVVVE
jgi:hypothetical protein